MNMRANYLHFQPSRNVDTYISQDWNSLFISVLPKEYCTESALVNLLENDLGIGYVEKVNIVNKKNPGKASHTIAFIHFHYWFRTKETEFIRTSIDSAGKCDIHGYFDQNEVGYSFQDSNGKPLYLRFAKYIPPLTITEKVSEQYELKAQALRITALESQMKQMISILLPVAQPEYTQPSVLNTLPVETPLWKYEECVLPHRFEALLDDLLDYPKKLSILLPEPEENAAWCPPKAPRSIPN